MSLVKKRFPLLIITILLTVFLVPGIVSASALSPTVILDGRQLTFEVPPSIEEGRVLVPLRTIFEELEAEVTWDGSTQTITAVKKEVQVKLIIGKLVAYKNGTPVTLDAPARIVNSRTLVPLYFVSEALGASVDWDEASRTVVITSEGFDDLASLLGQPSEWDAYEEPDGGQDDNSGIIEEILALL